MRHAVLKHVLDFENKFVDDVLRLLMSHTTNVRVVGGVVRDAIREGRHTVASDADVDVVTDLVPDRVIEIAKSAGYKVKDIGVEYGTVLIYGLGGHVEVTTLRVDNKCDGRYAEVSYTDSFEIDASRRDFGMNAMSYDPLRKVIFDYYNGVHEARSGSVVFIGDPKERIAEDALRILRFFRFASNFGDINDGLNEEALSACAEMSGLIKTLSAERILNEMIKLAAGRNLYAVLHAMVRTGVFQEVFSIPSSAMQKVEERVELFKNWYNLYDHVSNPLSVMMAVLFYDMDIFGMLKNNMKCSNAMIAATKHNVYFVRGFMLECDKPVGHYFSDEGRLDICFATYYLGSKLNVRDRQEINVRDYVVLFSVMHGFEHVLKVDGEALFYKMPINAVNVRNLVLDHGINVSFESAEVRNLLLEVQSMWVESKFTASKDEMMSRLINILTQNGITKQEIGKIE